MSASEDPRQPADADAQERDRHDLTELLHAAQAGQDEASSELLEAVYSHLKGLARRQLAHPAATLQPTELVHEAYDRLLGRNRAPFEDRRHFFRAAARSMRDIVADHARKQLALRRGGGAGRVVFEESALPPMSRPRDVVLLDDALRQLEDVDETSFEIVLLRFYAGLSGDETASILGISPSTVDRQWAWAKAWLHRELRPTS